ncbi:MAG: hypothetical protein Q9157_000086 [Trypethelium eluteriae]
MKPHENAFSSQKGGAQAVNRRPDPLQVGTSNRSPTTPNEEIAAQSRVASAPPLSLPEPPVQNLSALSPRPSVTSEVPTFYDTITENASLLRQIASKTQQHEQLLSRYQAVVHDEEQSRVFYLDFPALEKSKQSAVSKAKVALENLEQDLNNLQAQHTESQQRFALFLERNISQNYTSQKNQNEAHQAQIAALQNQICKCQADIQSKDEALKSITGQLDKMRKDFTIDARQEISELQKSLSDLRSSHKDALRDIGYLQADSSRLKKFRGEFTYDDLDKMWKRSKSASEGIKDIRDQDLVPKKDVDELRSSFDKRLDSIARRLGMTEEQGARLVTLGCKLEDLEKKTDQIANLTSGGFNGLVQALANSSPSILTEMQSFKPKLTEVKGDVKNLKEALDQCILDVKKLENDRLSSHPTSLASTDEAMAQNLEEFAETLDNEVKGRVDKTLAVFHSREDLEMALTRVRQDNGVFVMKQLATFEQKVMSLLKEDTSRIRQDLTELKSRPIAEDISSFHNRVMLVEGKMDELASKLLAQQSRHFADRISRIENVLKAMSPNHDLPTKSFGEPCGSTTPAMENPVLDSQPQLSDYAATGVGSAGEKFATVKFVQDRLMEVFIVINGLRQDTNTYDERVRKHDSRLDEICRSLETVRVPIQGLEKRFNELTTDDLLSLIMHEISRTFPDARNLQQVINHFHRMMNELHSPAGTLGKQSRLIDQLLKDVHHLQQTVPANGTNGMGDAIMRHEAKIGELDKAREDLSQRVERVLQTPTTLSRNVLDERQCVQNAHDSHIIYPDKLQRDLEELVKRVKEIENVEGTARVIILLRRLEQDVREISTRVGQRENLVDTVQGQVRSLEGQGNAQGDMVAKMAAAVDELNEKIGLPSMFEELT